MRNSYLLVLAVLFAWLVLPERAHAQMGINSPAGVRPAMDLELYSRNSFIVGQKYRPSTTNPLASTHLIGCTTGSNPPIYADAGIIMDPSGYTGYANNVEYRCGKFIYGSFGGSGTIVGIELIIEQLDLGPASSSSSGRDYLYISSDNLGPNNIATLVGTDNPGRIVIPDTEFSIDFYGSNDGIGGRGFRIQWRAIYAENTPEQYPLWTSASQLRFDIQTGALFAGSPPAFRGWTFGDYSVSLGQQNMARGNVSVAIGQENVTGDGTSGTGDGTGALAVGYSNFVSGNFAAAIGYDNTVSGNYGLAMGYRNVTSGNDGVALGRLNGAGTNAVAIGTLNAVGGSYGVGLGRSNSVGATDGVAIGVNNFVPTSSTNSVAIGNNNSASGQASMAIGTSLVASGISSLATGYLNTASGNYSTAMGHRMTTNGQAGAFLIGDTDPLGQGTTGAGSPDQFVARFRNGYYLMTSGTVTRTGVVIGAGQNAWSAISDSTRKERFVAMNHAEVLRKINAMKLTSWNYKGQREIRHYGPMAQDFYAAFGHDELGQVGCDTLINSHDFAGVTFAGVQALIRENERLRVETQDLRAEMQNLASLLAQNDARLRLLEQAILGRKRVASRRK